MSFFAFLLFPFISNDTVINLIDLGKYRGINYNSIRLPKSKYAGFKINLFQRVLLR